MIIIIEDRCVGCSLCVPSCPVEAITCYGTVTVSDACTDCLDCIDYCPKGAFQAPDSSEPETQGE